MTAYAARIGALIVERHDHDEDHEWNEQGLGIWIFEAIAEFKLLVAAHMN